MASEKSTLDLILGWWRLIWRVTVAAALVSVLVSLLLPNWYGATATCMPPQEGESRGSLLHMFTQIGMDLGAGGLLSSTPMSDVMIGVLKSRLLRGQVVDRFDLVGVYGSRSREHAIKDLEDHMVVTTTPEGLIEVWVEDRDPERAAGMANAFMEFLDDYNRRTSVERARRTREFIQVTLDENAGRLEAAAVALREFQEQHQTIDLSEQTRVTVEAIAELESQRTRLEVERGVLEGFSRPDQVRMRQIEAEVREIDGQIDQLRGTAGEEAGVLLPLSEIPELAFELADLMREVMVQEKVREFLNSQFEEARIQEARDLEVIHVLDRAVPPVKKARPRRSIVVLLTTGLAFVAALGLAFMADGILHEVESGSAAHLGDSGLPRLLVRSLDRLRRWGGPSGLAGGGERNT